MTQCGKHVKVKQCSKDMTCHGICAALENGSSFTSYSFLSCEALQDYPNRGVTSLCKVLLTIPDLCLLFKFNLQFFLQITLQATEWSRFLSPAHRHFPRVCWIDREVTATIACPSQAESAPNITEQGWWLMAHRVINSWHNPRVQYKASCHLKNLVITNASKPLPVG